MPACRFNAQLRHALLEQLAVFAALNGVQVAANHFHAVLVQHARVSKLNRGVQRRLSAQGGKQRIGALLRNDFFHELGRDGLNVCPVGQAGVGHDGCGIAVYQHHAKAVFLEHLARLHARIIELACLTDNNGARSNDQDGFDVFAFRHGWPPSVQSWWIARPNFRCVRSSNRQVYLR